MGTQHQDVMQATWHNQPRSHLEGLALALSSPDSQDEGDLDLGQVHEVLGDVDGQLVQEGGRDVEALLDVVEVAAGVGEIVGGAHDGVVGAAHARCTAREKGVDHVAAATDVLLRTHKDDAGWSVGKETRQGAYGSR